GGGLDRLGRDQSVGQRINKYREGHRFGAAHLGIDNGTGSPSVKLNGAREERLDRERPALDRNDFGVQSVFLEEPPILSDPKRQQLAAQPGASDADRRGISGGQNRGEKYY